MVKSGGVARHNNNMAKYEELRQLAEEYDGTNPRVFEKLYELFYNDVRSACYKHTQYLGNRQQDEVMSRTFQALEKRLRTFKPINDYSLYKFMATIAKHKYWKVRASEARYMDNTVPEHALTWRSKDAGATPSFEQLQIEADTKAEGNPELMARLEGAPKYAIRVVNLLLKGKDYATIAKELNLGVPSVIEYGRVARLYLNPKK